MKEPKAATDLGNAPSVWVITKYGKLQKGRYADMEEAIRATMKIGGRAIKIPLRIADANNL
jgi:hypothetical protein